MRGGMHNVGLRKAVTRVATRSSSSVNGPKPAKRGPLGAELRKDTSKRLVLPSQSLSTPTNSFTETLGVDTDLGKDLSSIPNAQLGQFRALVLDVSYRPLDTVPWTRAVVLDCFDKVDVLEYYDSFVRSARDYHYLPAVIRVKFYVKKLKGAFDKGVPLTRKNVYARDRHKCQYCGSTKNLTLDHVIPTSRGGGTEWDNLVTACNKCNQKKGNKLLKELGSGMKLNNKPKMPNHLEMSSYMVARQGGNAPKEWRDYLPPGTADWVFNND
ncbi:HNHc domain-containing protein [Chloropicon primus]|uniref:HNH nuclease domain-containing protein n=1 Tax=Chloropicon primus TaxID=1764295 RepID=A0A5B8MIP4_9CHLO|nr:hypothetical protein A3770_04p28310 [Chloropicon primus]UPQ99523.1 HNHc domain-containing protein [Chloropicon primus]|mmetsp:Transcript_10385/g.21284  ORF Transcript_10385/g.21284 Transcript_10385/m.21284 type:complete len:269 (+) Transcript_10385:370-1176(+)|eukprot:QDZ20313.1 hypothetical protein A3770_04p28310 [Chloropicon primus]